jgi:hypothetical protein
MRERGKYQIQCMKSRSSTGVGQKVDLEYNIETMRITDEGGDQADARPSGSALMESIKARSQAVGTSESVKPTFERGQPKPGVDPFAPKIEADVQSAKLKQLLGKIKSQ